MKAFEKYIMDTLNLFKQEVVDEINQLIDEEVLLPRIKARQANNPTWIDKTEALKAKYLVEERLKFEL